MTIHEIGEIDDFPEGKGRKVEANGIELAVFNVDGELYGIQNVCAHKSLPLHLAGEERYWSRELKSDRREGGTNGEERTKRGEVNGEDLTIRCPWHLMEWDLETGENGLTGRRIATYDVRVEDGTVYVEL